MHHTSTTETHGIAESWRSLAIALLILIVGGSLAYFFIPLLW